MVLDIYQALSCVKPDKNASTEAHIAYYKTIWDKNREIADRYYVETLYPIIVEKCRDSLAGFKPFPTRLVTVVSPNWEIIRLAVEVFRIKECLLLYTQPSDRTEATRQLTDMNEIANSTATASKKLGCEVWTEPFDYDSSQPDFRAKLSSSFLAILEKYFSNVPATEIVFDMHSAHKIFNYAFDHGVGKAGNLMFWIDHSWFPTVRTRKPLTERFIVWKHGENW